MSVPYLTLGDEALSSALLRELDVHQELNAHWTARVVLRDTPDRRPDVEGYAGKELKVSTFDLDGTETIIFQGIVRGMRLIYEITGAWGAELEAVSATWKMAQGKRLKYFRQQTAQATAQQVVSAGGLTLSGPMPAGATLSYVQWDETDYSFVSRLIDDTEAWFRPAVDGSGGLEVQTAFAGGPSLTWRAGEYDLLEWTTQGRLRPIAAEGAQYDYQPMRSQVSSGVSGTVPMYSQAADKMVAAAQGGSGQVEAMWIDRHRAATLDDLEARLAREARRGAANTVVCHGVSQNPKVRAGDTVQVTGLPDVDATYGVILVDHRWTTQGYENRFTATPAQKWSPPVRPARPLLDGVYPARVVDNHDPHNQGRVRVQYYWQEENETIWVRLLSAHAGASRGILFLPEVGDEVLVTFEEGDAERPYIVGSAWNGVHQPPATGFHQPGETNGSEFAANNIKRIVTKSGHRITLVDTPGKETISFTTPVSNRLMLTESHVDTGGRPAMVLETAGDMILAAPNGRIHLQSMLHSREVGTAGSAAMHLVAAQGASSASSKKTAAAQGGASSKSSASKPFDCKGSWASTVAEVNKTDDIQDPIQRNKKITAAYANIYKQTPDLQWAGLASVVSRNAGCGMVKAKGVADQSDQALEDEYKAPIVDPIGGPPVDLYNSGRGESAHVAYDALGNTNQTIYRTVAPTMTFVSKYGAKQLQKCTSSGAIPVQDHLSDKGPNSKLDNSAVPPQLQAPVAQLATAEDLPQGDPARAIADRSAANSIADYEQTQVVQQRIYDGNTELKAVMWANQKLSSTSAGQSMGATPPEIAFSANCNDTNRVPIPGSINDPTVRVQYYRTLMQNFSSQNPAARSSLIDALSKEPGF